MQPEKNLFLRLFGRLLKRKPVTKRRQKSEQTELSELKILSYRILNQRYIKWIDPAVDIVKIERQGLGKIGLV